MRYAHLFPNQCLNYMGYLETLKHIIRNQYSRYTNHSVGVIIHQRPIPSQLCLFHITLALFEWTLQLPV